jgi:hypothetical protein
VIERDEVKISGEVVGQTGFNDIREALKKIAADGKVTQQNAGRGTSTKTPFRFEFKVARTGGGS